MKRFFSKNIIRATVFLCLAALLTAGCSKVFGFADPDRTDNVLGQFYELEDNTVDCIFSDRVLHREPMLHRSHIMITECLHTRLQQALSLLC